MYENLPTILDRLLDERMARLEVLSKIDRRHVPHVDNHILKLRWEFWR